MSDNQRPSPGARRRTIKAEDLYRLQRVSDPQLSPDGKHIIFTVQRVTQGTEKTASNLWLVPAAGGRPRQFTVGEQSDFHPRWSPDGRQIAFLSNRLDERQFQIFLIPFFGGEARPLTRMKGTFAGFEWSPDGRRFVIQFRQMDAEARAREEDEQKRKLGVVARHITRLDYKIDGAGYLPQARWHIWTVDVRSGKGSQLTDDPRFNEVSPRWSPDGREILFFSNRSDHPDRDLLNVHGVELYVVPAEGGELRQIETPYGTKLLPAFSPDGRYIAYLGRPGTTDWWQNTNLWLVRADGGEPARNLTGSLDIHVGVATSTDSSTPPTLAPIWSADGQRIYFQVSRHGHTGLCSIGRDGSDWRTHLAEGVIGGYSFDEGQKRLAAFRATATDPGEIWSWQPGNDRLRQLTRFNTSWLRRVDLGQLEEVWYQGPDGNDLQGWILKPPGFDEDRRYPSILEIHGGPWGQYGHIFMHEFYLLAAHGYVVHFTNPRGGQGYGEGHSQALHRNWGTPDYADIMAWTDLVAARPYINPSRMGITGGSYGGYLTLWTIARTDRFRAAVAQRSLSNAISFWGSSDLGLRFEDVWSGQPPWEDLQAYWDQSPMKHVANISTPTLLIHSEQDRRCAPDQSEQVFVALRRLGVESELVLFPEESHGLSRIGRTDRRIARLNHMVRWFDRYLKA